MNGISTSGWFPIARLLRPQGRRGELLAEPLSDLPGLFDPPLDVLLGGGETPAPNATPLHIEDHWLPTGKNAGRIVLKLSGCDSISAAEALAGQQLFIASSQLPALDPGTFFVGDLLGCTVFDGPHPIGPIVDIEFATAPDGRTRLEDAAPLLAVELTSISPTPDTSREASRRPRRTVLIPFILAWTDSVDIPNRRIHMRLPDGLIDGTPGTGETPVPLDE